MWAGLDNVDDKPDFGTELDYDNPLVQGLVGCFPLNEGSGYASDILTGASCHGGTWGFNGLQLAGSAGSVASSVYQSSQAFSVFAVGYLVNYSAGGSNGTALFANANIVSSTNNQGFAIGIISGACFFAVFGNAASYATLASVTPTGLHSLCGVATSAGVRTLYIDGLQQAQTTSQPAMATASTTVSLSYGGGAYTILALVYNRALTSQEIVLLNENFYQIFVPPQQKHFLVSLARSVSNDAKLERYTSRTASADAQLHRYGSRSVTVDGRLERYASHLITTDAQLHRYASRTVGSDARLERYASRTASADARLKRYALHSVAADGHLERFAVRQVQADARLERVTARALAADGRLERSLVRSITVDAKLERLASHTLTVDGRLERVTARTLAVDGQFFRLAAAAATARYVVTAAMLVARYPTEIAIVDRYPSQIAVVDRYPSALEIE